MPETPVARAARIFLIALAVAILGFTLAKWAGLDGRPWIDVLSAAVVTAALVAMWRLVAGSHKAISRQDTRPLAHESENPRTRPPEAPSGCRGFEDVPAAKPLYGVVNVPFADRRAEEETRTVVALLMLVTVLAVATIWFVALPLFDEPASAPQDCKTFVLTKSGGIQCIPETTPTAS